MREIPLHSKKYKGYVALVDDWNYDWLNQYHWGVNYDLRGGIVYATTKINYSTVSMHRFIMGAVRGQLLDHIDHVGYHNWELNLRFATFSQNGANARPRSDGSSVYKGVCWSKSHLKWQVRVTIDGKQVTVAYCTDEIEAAKAYNKFAIEHYGPFAYLNPV